MIDDCLYDMNDLIGSTLYRNLKYSY